MRVTLTLRAALAGTLLVLVFAFSSCGTSEADGKVTVVGPREALALIASGDYVVLDLRSHEAFAAGHVAGAESLPFRDPRFEERLEALDPNQKYLVYSRRGVAADAATDMLVAAGFDEVVDAGAFGLLALAGAPLG